MTTIEIEIATEKTLLPDRVERVAAALRSHNIDAIVVDSGKEAREAVLGLIPDRPSAASSAHMPRARAG